MMMRNVVLLALCVAAPALAQSPEAAGDGRPVDYFARDTLRIDTLVCPFKGRIEYEAGEIECGLLQVPENREDPDSRFIELHFVKLNSTWDDEDSEGDSDSDSDSDSDNGYELAPGRRDDPVIYLTGGPGAGVENYVERFKDHGIRKHRDLYILEQRGIGTSGDFCREYFTRNPATFNVDSFEAQSDAQVIGANNCALNAMAAGVDVAAYNTIENARDVRALRMALGFEKWNVWGISYGSILGQAYIKEDPDGILAVVLDAIVPINTRDKAMYWQVVTWYDRDLKKLDELCQAHDDCAGTYPGLGDRVRAAAQSVEGNPIAVEVEDTELFPSGKAYFFTDLAGWLPFIFFYEQSNYAALPAVIYAWTDAVQRRDETLFKALALAPGDFFGGSQGMYDAIFCNDGHAEAQIAAGAADRAAFPILTGAFSPADSDLKRAQRCHDVGLIPRDRSQFEPVETDLPTLLVEGDMDPITPPPLAKAIEPGFSNGTYVEFPYAGHGPSRSVDCAGDMLNAFYDDPTAEPDLSCVDEMETPDFIVPLYLTGFAPRVLTLALEDKKALVAPGVWGGLSLVVVLVAFIVLTFAPLVRRIDGRSAVAAGGARWAAWAAALFGTFALAVFGAAGAATVEASEVLIIFGMVPWARFAAWAGLFAGLAGIAAIVLTVRHRMAQSLPNSSFAGLVVTGVAAVSLSVFLMYWDLGAF